MNEDNVLQSSNLTQKTAEQLPIPDSIYTLLLNTIAELEINTPYSITVIVKKITTKHNELHNKYTYPPKKFSTKFSAIIKEFSSDYVTLSQDDKRKSFSIQQDKKPHFIIAVIRGIFTFNQLALSETIKLAVELINKLPDDVFFDDFVSCFIAELQLRYNEYNIPLKSAKLANDKTDLLQNKFKLVAQFPMHQLYRDRS